MAWGDLSQYNAIVTGVRAYERRADLRANNHRLLKYVENGGTAIVQYNRQEFNQAQYGPYKARTSSERITDENAPVKMLVPGHPVFNAPNKLNARDWQGWVQERGTYFLEQPLDAKFVDLVEMEDPFPFNPGPSAARSSRRAFRQGTLAICGPGPVASAAIRHRWRVSALRQSHQPRTAAGETQTGRRREIALHLTVKRSSRSRAPSRVRSSTLHSPEPTVLRL